MNACLNNILMKPLDEHRTNISKNCLNNKHYSLHFIHVGDVETALCLKKLTLFNFDVFQAIEKRVLCCLEDN